jgi:Flp pilus assembly pilin Flp
MIKNLKKSFLTAQQGSNLAEYAVLLGLVVMVAITAVFGTDMHGTIGNFFTATLVGEKQAGSKVLTVKAFGS